MVIPENSFPAMEHSLVDPPVYEMDFKGKSCLGGYQSHFTLVDGRDIDKAFPVRGPIDTGTAGDEMVTFDSAQALPLFLLHQVSWPAAVFFGVSIRRKDSFFSSFFDYKHKANGEGSY